MNEEFFTNTLLFINFFRVLSTSKVVYVRRQSDAQLSRSNAREICAFSRCRVIAIKITSLCYIISMVSYILRVRFGGRVRLKPREKLTMFQLRKSLKVGQPRYFLTLKTIYSLFSFLCLSVVDLHWILSKAFASFLHVSRERIV